MWRTAFQFPERLGKIAHFLKAALQSDIRNFQIGTEQQFGSFLDSHLFDVLDGTTPDHTSEAPQTFAFTDVGTFRNL